LWVDTCCHTPSQLRRKEKKKREMRKIRRHTTTHAGKRKKKKDAEGLGRFYGLSFFVRPHTNNKNQTKEELKWSHPLGRGG